MTVAHRWTVKDLETLPDDGSRYEIIDGELYVSKQPHYYHQLVCLKIGMLLESWSSETQLGEVNFAPGVIFAEDDAVAPDLIWISNVRLATALTGDGKLHEAPELVIEVLSPGHDNERRDREIKLALYSRRGVLEYWLIDWRTRSVEVYRRQGADLRAREILGKSDTLNTPLLPRFACSVGSLFARIPEVPSE